MKKLIPFLAISLLLIYQTFGGFGFNPNRASAQRPSARPPLALQDSNQEDFDPKREAFKSGRDLLIKKGVPFEPNVLLESNWREQIAPVVGQMPEMSEVRRAPEKLSGVHIADTLYVPEQVQLTGDTVILARQLVFEGRNVLIKGNHAIHVFPIESEKLANFAADGRGRKRGAQFYKANYSSTSPRQATNQSMTITIDTSGLGRKEWLEQQQAAAQIGLSSRKRYRRKANHLILAPGQLVINHNGDPNPGATGTDGPLATGGQPPNP